MPAERKSQRDSGGGNSSEGQRELKHQRREESDAQGCDPGDCTQGMPLSIPLYLVALRWQHPCYDVRMSAKYELHSDEATAIRRAKEIMFHTVQQSLRGNIADFIDEDDKKLTAFLKENPWSLKNIEKFDANFYAAVWSSCDDCRPDFSGPCKVAVVKMYEMEEGTSKRRPFLGVGAPGPQTCDDKGHKESDNNNDADDDAEEEDGEGEEEDNGEGESGDVGGNEGANSGPPAEGRGLTYHHHKQGVIYQLPLPRGNPHTALFASAGLDAVPMPEGLETHPVKNTFFF